MGVNEVGMLQIFGVIFVLFIPGLAWSFIFFNKKEIDWIERIALSFGLSIAIIPLTVFYLNFLFKIKITLINISLITAILTVIPVIYHLLFRVLSARNMKYSAGDRKILFITRKFPPMKGGMETAAYELFMHLQVMANVELIKWSGSNKWLPLLLPYMLLKSIYILLRDNIDAIYLQDGLLAPLGLVLKRVFSKPTIITIHGLDITYKNRLYQLVIPSCVKRLDKVICVSNATKRECVKRKIPIEKASVIPNGISDKFVIKNNKKELRDGLSRKLQISLNNKKILLSVGRLVERKGYSWFIEKVIPELLRRRNDIVYIIVGGGVLRKKIRRLISKNNLEDYVFLLGKVDDEMLRILYNSSDIFVMPNIPVKGDMEGFGLVLLEAISCDLSVVASRIGGIKDVVKDGITGFLIDPYNRNGYIETINSLLENKDTCNHFQGRQIIEIYSWEKIAKKYLKEVHVMINLKC